MGKKKRIIWVKLESIELNGKSIVGIGNSYSMETKYAFTNSYRHGSEINIQFKATLDNGKYFPAGSDLFRIQEADCYPKEDTKLPAIIRNNNSLYTYFVTVTKAGFIKQNFGNNVTEIFVNGSYVV